jgi:hypothetical protein
MRGGHRFCFLLAMNCQVAAVAADGTEVPSTGAPAVREYGAVLSTNFLGLHPSTAVVFPPLFQTNEKRLADGCRQGV